MGSNTRQFNLTQPFNFRMAVTTAGTPETLGVKLRGATIAFNQNATGGDTITDSGNAFLINGFEVGDQVVVTGATNPANNATWVVAAVVAGTLTLTTSGQLTTEVAGATVTLKVSKVIPEGIVVDIKARDANTGLIHLGRSSVGANKDNNQSFTLKNNEDIELQLKETGQLWVDAGTSGETVEVIFEKNPKT